MPLLVKADLKTHQYTEIIDEITRADDTIVDKAILRGEAEAKAYLNRFDIAAMFVTTNTDEFLRGLVKDLVCWHLIKLCNPNINLELFRTIYEDAKAMFKDIMKGNADPAGWPLRADDADTPNDESGHIYASSNTRRNNHY